MKNKWFLWGERVVGKVERITERIIENEQEVKELLSKQSIEDLYEFFLSKDSTLTAKEFDDEVYDILEYYSKNISESLEELEEIETKQIAGGKSDFIKKSLSASLCALTLNSGINVSASPVSVNSSSQNAVSILENKNQQDSLTFGEKIKAWAIKNKKALIITGITVAVIAGIIIAVVVYKNKNSVSGTGTPPAQVLNLVDNTENHEESADLSATQSKNESGKETSVTSAPAAQSKNESVQKTSAKPVEGQTENSTGQKSSVASNENRARGQSTTAPETNPKSGRAPAVQLKNEGQPPTKSPSNTPTEKSGATVPPAAKLDGKSGQGTPAKPPEEHTDEQQQTAKKPGIWGNVNVGERVEALNKQSQPKIDESRIRSVAAQHSKNGSANSSGVRSKIQPAVMGSTGGVAGASGGRSKVQLVVAGSTGGVADASGVRSKIQPAVMGSTGGAADVSGGRLRDSSMVNVNSQGRVVSGNTQGSSSDGVLRQPKIPGYDFRPRIYTDSAQKTVEDTVGRGNTQTKAKIYGGKQGGSKPLTPMNGVKVDMGSQMRMEKVARKNQTEREIKDMESFHDTHYVQVNGLCNRVEQYNNGTSKNGTEASATRSTLVEFRDKIGHNLSSIERIALRIEKNSELKEFESSLKLLKEKYELFFQKVEECCETFEQTPEQMEYQRELFVAVAERRKRVDEVTK